MNVCMRICGALMVLALVLLLAGCGGGGDNGSSNAPGSVQLTLDWPALTRVVPAGTQSFSILLKQSGAVVGQRVVTRPAGDLSVAVQSKERFDNLTAGDLQFTIRAYNNTTAAGAPIGEAAGMLVVKGGSSVPLVVSAAMASTIDHLEVSAQSGAFEVMKGNLLQLFATAKDAQNRIITVPAENLVWSYPDPLSDGRVKILEYGTLQGLLVGYAVVTVTETDSGKMAEATIKVSEPMSAGTAVFTVDWPTRSRVVPKVAESLAIEIWNGNSLLATDILNRPATGGKQEKSFYYLPLNATLTYVATAYPSLNKVGVPVGVATDSFIFKQPQTLTFALSAGMVSTITSLSLSAPIDPVELLVNREMTLLLAGYDDLSRVVPINPGDIQWTSSNTSVATVSNGVVRGVSPGTITITAKDLTSNVSATLTVVVKAYLISVSVSPTPVTVKQGGTQQFNASVSVEPTGAGASTQVTWSVQEGATAGTISQNGLYSAPGSVTVTTAHILATSVADTSKRGSATVTLRPATAPTARFSVTPTSGDTDTVFSFDAGGSTDGQDTGSQLKVRWQWTAGGTWEPATPTATKTATHQYATITGESQTFQATVEVTDTDGMTSTTSKSITVTKPGVKVTPEAPTVFVTETQQFDANMAVTWSVVESGGGTITGSGLYTAPDKAGTFHVRATATDGTNRTFTATITVPTPEISFADTTGKAITSLTAQVLSTKSFIVVKQNTNKPVQLTVDETGGGTITNQSGTYSAPAKPQLNTIRATLQLTSGAATARRGRATFSATLPVMVIQSLDHDNDAVTAVAYSPHKVADVYMLGRALDTGVLVVDSQRWTGHTGAVNSIAFNPPNAAEKVFLLASGGEDGKVRLWNPLTGGEKALPTSASTGWHTKAVNCVALGLNPNVTSDEELYLASGGDDNTAKLWKVNFATTATPPVTLTGHRGTVNAVAFNTDGGWLVTGDSQGYLYLWNVRNGGAIGNSWDAKLNNITALAFSPDGTMIAAGNSTGRIKIFERSTGSLLKELVDTSGTAHLNRVSGLSWCPEAPTGEIDHNYENIRLVSSGYERNASNVKLWDITTGAPLRTYAGHDQEATGVAFRPDAYIEKLMPAFASSGNDGFVIIWP